VVAAGRSLRVDEAVVCGVFGLRAVEVEQADELELLLLFLELGFEFEDFEPLLKVKSGGRWFAGGGL